MGNSSGKYSSRRCLPAREDARTATRPSMRHPCRARARLTAPIRLPVQAVGRSSSRGAVNLAATRIDLVGRVGSRAEWGVGGCGRRLQGRWSDVEGSDGSSSLKRLRLASWERASEHRHRRARTLTPIMLESGAQIVRRKRTYERGPARTKRGAGALTSNRKEGDLTQPSRVACRGPFFSWG